MAEKLEHEGKSNGADNSPGTWRAGLKADAIAEEGLRKAIWYARREIEWLEKERK